MLKCYICNYKKFPQNDCKWDNNKDKIYEKSNFCEGVSSFHADL